jgi:CubicO group peptidase (beta-lactamase class C family)
MKSQLFYLTLLLASNSIIVKAYRPCPILGLGFTAPKNLCSSSTIQAAAENLTNVINSAVLTGNTTHGVLRSNTSSFSIEIFTAHNATPLYNYHHSSPILAKGASGVKNVDSNSIYRIGSITKLFTVYTYLLQTGFKYFDEPITKFVPELLEATRTRNSSDNPIDNVAWEDITIRDLASYMADIGRDCKSRKTSYDESILNPC